MTGGRPRHPAGRKARGEPGPAVTLTTTPATPEEP